MADEATGKQFVFWRLLWGMVRHPGATLAMLNEDGGRAWLWMALLALVLTIAPVWAGNIAANRQASAVPIGDYSSGMSDPRVSAVAGAKGYDLAPQGAEFAGGDMPATPSGGGIVVTLLSALGSAAGVMVRWLLWAVALYIVATVSGGRSSFGQTLHMITWTWLPYAARGLSQTVYLLVGGAPIDYPGLSGFAPGARAADGATSIASAIWQHLLGQVDVFWGWNLVLLVLGIMTVAHLARRKSILATAGVWVLITALGLVPVLIRASLAGGGF